MANPTLPSLADHAAAVALGATTDADTGIPYVPFNSGPNDTPTLYTRLVQEMKHIKTHLEGLVGGKVVHLSGLNIGVFALNYMIGTTAYAYAGVASVAATASVTRYYWVDTDGVLENAAAWPGTPHFKLAKVTCSGTAVTEIIDCRWMNFRLGDTEEWWGNAAGGDVDMGDYSVDELGGLKLTDFVSDTISSGAITYAGVLMEVNAEVGLTDDLDTITYADADIGRLLIITAAPGDTITVRDGIDNIHLTNCDAIINNNEFIGFVSDGAHWYELFRTLIAPTELTTTLDCNAQPMTNVGRLNVYGPLSRTIAAGAIAYSTVLWYSLLNQSGDPTDELDTISGGADGDLMLLQAESGAQVPTIKHNTGNIWLANGVDYELSDTKRRLVLQYDGTLSKWVEVARSHWGIFDLTGTGYGQRWQPVVHIPETVAANTTYKMRIYVKESTYINDFAASVATAPVGGDCVVQIYDDGVPLINNPAATILDGTQTAQSAGGAADLVAAGSILEIHTVGVGVGTLADGLTVTINGRKSVPAS